MKAVLMSFEEVYAQLEAWGAENVRKIYAKQGAGENQFGVLRGNLRGLAKKLKTNHPLAMQLWATGNADAMILATMLMDGKQLSATEVEGMVQPLTYATLVDELMFNAVASAPCAEELIQRWTASPDELTGRAGWNLLIARVMRDETEGLDLDAILAAVEAEMKDAPERKQFAMNRCLVEIAVRIPEHRARCIEIAERLGPLDDRPVPKGCTSSYAPEWIAAVLKRRK